MKTISCVLAIMICFTGSVFSKTVEPIILEHSAAPAINQNQLYTEFEKLFDEYSEECISRKIGSRSPFINLLKKAMLNSGASYADFPKVNKNCKSYIQEDISFTFEHYYKHHCSSIYINNTETLRNKINKGESVANVYNKGFKNACGNAGKNSLIWYDEWSVALNTWSTLLTDKAQIQIDLISAKNEKLRILKTTNKKPKVKEAKRKQETGQHQKKNNLSQSSHKKEQVNIAHKTQISKTENSQSATNHISDNKNLNKKHPNNHNNSNSNADEINHVNSNRNTFKTKKNTENIDSLYNNVKTNDNHLKTFFILILFAFFIVLTMGLTNKIVIYYDSKDFLISFLPWTLILLGYILVSIYQEGNESFNFNNLSVLQTSIWYICVIASGLAFVWSIKLSIKYNQSKIIGVIVGTFKVFSSLIGVLAFIGSLNKIFGNDSKTTRAVKRQNALIGLIIMFFLVWLGRKLINGEDVYLAKGWNSIQD